MILNIFYTKTFRNNIIISGIKSVNQLIYIIFIGFYLIFEIICTLVDAKLGAPRIFSYKVKKTIDFKINWSAYLEMSSCHKNSLDWDQVPRKTSQGEKLIYFI